MTITNGYATLTQIKSRLGIAGITEDTLLEEAVESASREIDKHCFRRFYKDSATSVRTYRPDSECLAIVDDFWDTSSLVVKTDSADDGTYATTLTLNTDYILEPLNGVVDGESGWPYWVIRTVRSAYLPTWTTRPSVQVTAKWGWAAVPSPVYQACLILAQANYKLKDSAFGTIGAEEVGVVPVSQVPAAKAKLERYVRLPYLGV